MQRRALGFSLLELTIAVGVAAILASLGWASYEHVQHRVRRADAWLSLLRIQHAQEAFYARHHHYAATLAADGLALANRSDGGDYVLTLESGVDQQSYLASAIAGADGRQHADEQCRALLVDELGGKRSRNAAGESSNGPAPCW